MANTTQFLDYAGLETFWYCILQKIEDQISSSSHADLCIVDKITGHNYVLEIANGQLMSSCKIDESQGISLQSYPVTTTGYINGQLPDTSGMVITAVCEDGTTKVLEHYTCSPIANDTSTITYTELGKTYTLSIPLGSSEATTVLQDFDYTASADGTSYTLNNWKGTTDGLSGTEIKIPNNSSLII